MLYSLRLLLFSINIDQETILNWFGIEPLSTFSSSSDGTAMVVSKPALSFETFQLVIGGLSQRIQEGLTLTDLENILFFLLFLRFIILVFRYNLKTSFYITCIGLCAGYLWYRHLIDVLLMYRQILVKIPYLQKLGTSVIELEVNSQTLLTTD